MSVPPERDTYVLVGGGDLHLPLHHPTADAGGHGAGAQPGRPAQLPVPHQRRAAPHSREEVVHGAVGHRGPRGHPALWLHLHRDVGSAFASMLLARQNPFSSEGCTFVSTVPNVLPCLVTTLAQPTFFYRELKIILTMLQATVSHK